MARMIPEILIDVGPCNAERDIFKLFRDAHGTEDWIVLHSYHVLSKSGETEIDFVVLAPGLGIFGIEVKGWLVSQKNGIYYVGNDQLKRSPFEQARGGIHALMKYIENMEEEKYCFGYGVMFPHTYRFEMTGTEAKQWQIFDRRNNNDVVSFIRQLSNNYNQFGRHKMPDQIDIQRIAELLKPDIETILKDSISVAEGELARLTNKQKGIFYATRNNPRIIIEGSAGTGKTILAIEAAKQASKQGLKTAIFCYNTLVAEDIKKRIDSPNIEVSTIHDFMLNHIHRNNMDLIFKGEKFDAEAWAKLKKLMRYFEMSKSDAERYNDRDFWEKVIPGKMLDTLKIKPVQFDKIIVDESQDLIKGKYLDVFDKLLKGGLKDGKWILCVDPDQNIIGLNLNPDIKQEGHYTKYTLQDIIKPEPDPNTWQDFGSPHKCTLDMNCRNTVKIGKQLETLIGQELQCKFEDIPCPEVYFELWAERGDQINILNEILKILIERHEIKRSDIVILLPQTSANFEKEILFDENGKSRLDFNLNSYGTGESDGIAFTSVGKFKGMESPVVILLDVDSYRKDNRFRKLRYVDLSRARDLLKDLELKDDRVRKLMYVGLSRARDLLIVLESENARNECLENNGLHIPNERIFSVFDEDFEPFF